MDVGALPDGLPPGRLLAPDPEQPARWTDRPVCWVSDQPLIDAPQQWARLHAIRDRTGLWPVLLGRIDAGERQRPPPRSCDPRELDALDAETILHEKWQHLVRLHQQVKGYRLWLAEGPQGVRIVDAAARPEGFQPLPEGVRVVDCWTPRPGRGAPGVRPGAGQAVCDLARACPIGTRGARPGHRGPPGRWPPHP